VSVLLAGCQGLPLQQKSSLTEAELFAQGLDQYSETGDLKTLQRLPQEDPDGAWGRRAALVVKLAEQQEKLAADKEKMSDMQAGALARCDHEMAVLRQTNQELEETIAQLKKLLIEMELRSN
jgi:multidrug resistance efflux pump